MITAKILKNLFLSKLRTKKAIYLLLIMWQTLNVSAYTYSGNPTASGVYPQIGHCAADHLPFGSRVTLPDGRTLIVTDRFGGNYTDRLDIFLPTENECWKWGRRTLECKVEIP